MSFQDTNPGGVWLFRSEPELTPAARTGMASPSASRQAGRQAASSFLRAPVLLFHFGRLEQVSLYAEKEAGCQLKQQGGGESRRRT